MIYIRTDANGTIAMGHVMRCLAIARAIRKYGEDCTFITADRYAEEIIVKNGFSILCLESQWSDLNKEIGKLEKLIEKNKIQTMLIDSYYVTKKYLSTLQKKVMVAYIDDINQFVYPIDLLINYSISYSKFNYFETYNVNSTKLCLGSNYIPLRDEFFGKARNIKEKVKDVLITTGGSDPCHLEKLLLEDLAKEKKLEKIKFHVVIGKFSKDKLNLKKQYDKCENIILYEDLSQMAELMMKCDLAISAGGTTLFELCACGLPTICFAFADNQLSGIEEFHRQKIMKSVGDIRINTDAKIIEIKENVIKMIINKECRVQYSEKMQRLIDGKGAQRVAECILNINKK